MRGLAAIGSMPVSLKISPMENIKQLAKSNWPGFVIAFTRNLRNCIRNHNLNIMEKAIEVVNARIKAHQAQAQMLEDSEQSFLLSKDIRKIFDLVKEDEAIIKLLTEAS